MLHDRLLSLGLGLFWPLTFDFSSSNLSVHFIFILKIELSGFEQVFKIAETDLQDIDLIEKNLNSEFFSNCLTRFIAMREDWNQLINQK